MRGMLIWIVAVVVGMAAGIVRGDEGGAVKAGRPDVVLFVGDDFSWHDCGPYGSTEVRTPNLDRLAREGMTVRRAFAASPTCTPSRSAIYTGLMPMRNGAHSNATMIKEGVRTLPEYMKERGYRVVIAGKTHFGPRDQFPFEYLADSNVMPPGKHALLWTDLNTKAVDKLLAEHDQKVPLCLVVCSHSSHVYWMDNDGYNQAKVTLPPFLVDTPVTRAARCRYYTDVSHMDAQVGDVLASLKKYGYEDHTLFMFTADQGAQWPFGKWCVYDEGIRSPLLVRWPGKVKAGSSTDAMVSLVDLLPTFVEAAGGKGPEGIDGRSLMGVITGKTDTFRTEIYATHTGDTMFNKTPMRCVRTDRWKYILNLMPETQFSCHISEGGVLDGKDYWDSWEQLAASGDRHA
jgi:arylsulfatase A-like enzyme